MPTEPYSYREFELDSEQIYAHLLNLRAIETPKEILQRFSALFIEGSDYPEQDILSSVHRVVGSPWATQEFSHILSRCCYILLNYWWLQNRGLLDVQLQNATIELVQLIGSASLESAPCVEAQQLRELVSKFTHTEHYAALQRRALATGHGSFTANQEDTSVGQLIHRYPYLYPHLLDGDTSEMGQEAIKQLQLGRERKFERELMDFTNGSRRASRTQQSTIVTVKNPTLLSTDQLAHAIKVFAGKGQGSRSYQDSARHFLVGMRDMPAHRAVKQQMYDYLTTSVQESGHNPAYGNHQFNRWLGKQLDSILPQSDHLKPNEPLLVRTCGHLIDSLIASPNRFEHHVFFIDLINNLGATSTVGLLLKIVLLCRNITDNLKVMRSHLAKRFSVLFKYYESNVKEDLNWLVECLDNWLVASTIHFGQQDPSIWAKLI